MAVLDLFWIESEYPRTGCGISRRGMLYMEEDRRDLCVSSGGELGSLGREDAVVAGLLWVGVFGLEIQTPSTSIPLSIARMPKGISLPLRLLTLSA